MNTALAQVSRLRQLYQLIIRYAQHPRALWWVNLASFAESSFFPLPPDLMIIPMLLSQPNKAWVVASTCSISSVLGGIVGYGIGYFLYEAIGQSIIQLYHLENSFQLFQTQFQQWGFWIIMAKGLTPIPYKLVTIASGVAGLDLGKFILASMITRSFRFFLLSALLWRFGERARTYIEGYLGWVLVGMLLTIVLGYILVKVLLG
jgi:membrane protein YqaA with SNARE-associated domain